jgi:hypothetical protein
MPRNSEYRFWWEKVADYDSKEERENFIKGVMGAKPQQNAQIVQAVIAGYVAGRIAKSGRKK